MQLGRGGDNGSSDPAKGAVLEEQGYRTEVAQRNSLCGNSYSEGKEHPQGWDPRDHGHLPIKTPLTISFPWVHCAPSTYTPYRTFWMAVCFMPKTAGNPELFTPAPERQRQVDL